MTQSNHPSKERISDLLAGTLPAAEAMQVNAHLTGCAECRDAREALLAVAAVLAEMGASSWAMPVDVVSRVDTALAQASTERAADVRHLDSESVPRAGRSRPLTWLLGAAAAVVVATAGVAGIRALPPQGDDADSTAAGSEVQDQRYSSSHPPSGAAGEGRSEGYDFSTLTADAVPAAARRLAASPIPDSLTNHPCARPISGDRSTVVRFAGRPAILSITRDTRTAVVLDCATATRSLFVTGY